MKRILCALILMLVTLTAPAGVRVSTRHHTGPIKLMNAVNNGPVKSGGDQVNDNFKAYADCSIPYARTHDAAFNSNYGGEHSTDISAIFPDFSKDVNDPASYDFTLTDKYLSTMREAGTEPFFRLGQKIEHNVKKYHIYPPSDYVKWARICEHIIRHYNQGWADGYHWNIQYWEIWNEPDLDSQNEAWKVNPRTWGGSPTQFFEFFEVAAGHLKRCFPDLKIGGPALAWNEQWAEEFLRFMSQRNVQMDFFSWHIYSTEPVQIAQKASRMRQLMDRYGYGQAESILNEWNYVRDWTDQFQYSIRQINSLKGGAFVASVLCALQAEPVDMLMYYDARPTTFNGLFDLYSYRPQEAYYALYAWNKLLRLGTQAQAVSDEEDLFVTAATDGTSRSAVLVSRYNEDNNVVAKKKVSVTLEGVADGTRIVGHLTDVEHLYTEVPLKVENGAVDLILEPLSFMMIEMETP